MSGGAAAPAGGFTFDYSDPPVGLLEPGAGVDALELVGPVDGALPVIARPPALLPGVWRFTVDVPLPPGLYTPTVLGHLADGTVLRDPLLPVQLPPDIIVGEFGASLRGARGLLVDIAAEGRRPAGGALAPQRVPDSRVVAWLAEGSARVANRLRGWGRLTEQSEPAAEDVRVAARGLVELYAAAWLEDATHPARTGSDSRYGQVLYSRFSEGLDELAGAVAAALDAAGGDVAPIAPGVQTSGIAAAFPPPSLASRSYMPAPVDPRHDLTIDVAR